MNLHQLVLCWCVVLLSKVSPVVLRLAEPTEEPSNPQIVTTLTTPPTTTAKTISPQFADCYYEQASICIGLKENGQCLPKGNHEVVCCHLNSLTEYYHSNGVRLDGKVVESLHLINATIDTLNLAHPAWKNLKSMSLTDGHIKKAIGIFSVGTSIKCLNLSNNRLEDMEPTALVNLKDLTTVDLSSNNLEDLPKFYTNLSIDISNNTFLECLNLQVRMSGNLKFLNQNNTSCLSSKSFHWFNTTEHVPFTEMEHIVELSLNCPVINNKSCTCLPHRLDLIEDKPPSFAVKVDCSHHNLTELPVELPPNTIILNVSYNNIQSLSLLNDDAPYKDIRELYADHNEITSILKLEGTKFIDNFATLSLRANKLKNLPTYFLSNTIDRKFSPRFVHLGDNYLTCDCNTVKVLKVWLLGKQKNIPDYDEIWCENLPEKVIDLDQTAVCQYQKDWTDYIYYIITGEVLLLFGLISKVSYDYWVFKTAGYLPWPASRMPKLPCDWLCET